MSITVGAFFIHVYYAHSHFHVFFFFGNVLLQEFVVAYLLPVLYITEIHGHKSRHEQSMAIN